MKKIFGLMLCSAMLVFVSVNVYADSDTGMVAGDDASADIEFETGGSVSDEIFTYYIEDGKASVEGFVLNMADEYKTGIYTVPSEINGVPVTTVSYGAFQFKSGITELTLPESITYISQDAFSYCANMKKLTILSYDLEIYGTIIDGCSSDLVLYGYKYSPVYDYAEQFGVTFSSIGDMPRIAVDGGDVCDGITWSYDNYERLTISGTGAMPDYVSDNDTPWSNYVYNKIKEVVIEDGITHVGNYMCYYSDTLEKLTVAGSVKTIGDFAFGYCVKLSEVNLNEGLEYIGRGAIARFESSITIPSTIKEMAESAIPSRSGDTALTIKGVKDSYAESYAQSKQMNFEAVSEAVINEVYVTTTEELIDAIASNTVITMADGVYIVDDTVIHETEDGEIGYDCIHLKNILNLTIKAENPGKVEILAMQDGREQPETTMIFRVSDCDDIVFDGLRIGNREVRYSLYSPHTKEEVQIMGGYMQYSEYYGIYVELGSCDYAYYPMYYQRMPNDVTIKNCDIFNCTYPVYQWEECYGTLEIRDTVLRDSYIGAVYTNSHNFIMDGCTVMTSGCSAEYKGNYCVYADNHESVYSENSSIFTNNVFVNNHNPYFYWTCADNKTESGNVTADNAWDSETPQSYGICKNGITWQVVSDDSGNVLKLGYDIERDTASFESEKGKVYPYTACSEPWRGLDISLVDLAEGVTLSSDISALIGYKTDYEMNLLMPIAVDFVENKLVIMGYNTENAQYSDLRLPENDELKSITFDYRANAIKVFLWESLDSMKPVSKSVNLY